MPDDKLGWKPIPDYRFEGVLTDYAGENYEVNVSIDKHGFRSYGDTNAVRPKVLFIGDSYTSGIEVSDEKTFYSVIEKTLEVEVFAIGQAGYGTLQEYLVLDEWIDHVTPDLVIWQFCCNDFIDNYAPLEMACGYKIGKRRPYWQDGQIAYQRPLTFWQKTKEQVFFYRWLEDHWHPCMEKLFGWPRVQGEDFIKAWGKEYPPFQTSIAATEELLKKVKVRMPTDVPIIAFAADHYPVQIAAAQRIFSQAAIPFYDEPALKVIARQQVVNCHAKDGYHWNEEGHRIIATSLLPLLEQTLSLKTTVKCDSIGKTSSNGYFSLN